MRREAWVKFTARRRPAPPPESRGRVHRVAPSAGNPQAHRGRMVSRAQQSATTMRSAAAGTINLNMAGREVRVAGWVHRRRDLGGLAFLDLRDRSGVLQASAGPEWSSSAAMEAVRGLGLEDVVAIRGVVSPRPEAARNPGMATGDVEVRIVELEVLNRARTPEIPVYLPPEEELPSEKLRLRHRVLDLRRGEIQDRLELRHRLILAARNYFHDRDFMEVETPILTKPTPEGARDFLVPSRVHPGEFFALPQSPQIYKQLLMIAGFDRYVQIARCFRDEDLRADRQPEFTQIDVEASFVQPDDIHAWCEGLMEKLAEVAGIDAPTPFLRLAYHDVMERFGSDRPDLRYALEIRDFTEVLGALDFGILRGAIARGGRIRGLRLEGGAR
ncbi:MAG: aspartate--tRNA ligase, partial [Gemmatimonadetes bacterium]|nr:aspartate--tRNA ligase [Gemmatimonadota bacterium]